MLAAVPLTRPCEVAAWPLVTGWETHTSEELEGGHNELHSRQVADSGSSSQGFGFSRAASSTRSHFSVSPNLLWACTYSSPANANRGTNGVKKNSKGSIVGSLYQGHFKNNALTQRLRPLQPASGKDKWGLVAMAAPRVWVWALQSPRSFSSPPLSVSYKQLTLS